MTKQEAQALIKKYGGIRAAARFGDVDRKTIYRALRRKDGKPKAKRTLDSFRQEYDLAFKIRQGIKRLLAGDVYMTEAEFRGELSAHHPRWRTVAESEEFAANRYRVQGQVLWASEATIRAMRRIRGEAN